MINHWVLHSPPIDLKELGLVGDFQNSHVLICLPLYAIFLNKTVMSSETTKHVYNNIIHSMYTIRPQSEAQLSTCLVRHNKDRGCACFQERYYLGYV